MATFPSIIPQYGQRKKSSPNTQVVRFADGYEHRILFGLAEHQNPKEFSFSFDVSEAEADVIEAFLDARALDRQSFTFTPPGESSSSQFVCENWTKSIPYLNRANIQVSFREVFEPAS
jgi:phage-related protein|tara:strand:+ start:428 stop:781 length:354 start_codon:yes stop_codon:yes gene_type:complete